MYSAVVVLGNLALLFCSVKPLFKLLSAGLNFILTAVEGANYLILKLCPPVSSMAYLDGIAFILMYMSFVFYKHGFKKFKYLPVFILIMMMCSNYSFIPQVYYAPFEGGEAVIIKYKFNRIMICNYEQSSAKKIIDLKEEMGINEIITNPQKSSVIKFDNRFYAKVIPYYENRSINIGIYSGTKKIIFIDNDIKKEDISVFRSCDKIRFPNNDMLNSSSKNSDYSSENKYNLYAIIFDRVIKIY
jgi:competence protein ComEC